MPASAPPKNKPGGLAVLAEIEVIEPELKRHRQQFSQQFSSSLSPKVPANIVTQTVHQSLENIGRVQSTEQLEQVVADALTQGTIGQEGLVKDKAADQIYEKLQGQATEIVSANQKGLEEEAVLANLAQIASLEKPDQKTQTIIADEVESTIESEDPLMPPDERDQLFADINDYLGQSRGNLNKELAGFSLQNLPTLAELQAAKEKAAQNALSQIESRDSPLDVKNLASTVGAVLGTKPITPKEADNFGLGFAQPNANTFKTQSLEGQSVGLRLSSNTKDQGKAVLALVAHDSQKMDEINRYPKLKEFSFFKKAKEFSSKQSGETAKYTNHFQQFPGGLNRASQTTWRTIFTYLNRYPGIFVPQSIVNDSVLVNGSIGALSHGSGNFSVGNVVSGAQGLTSGLKGAIGFGKGAKGAVMAGKLALGASNPAGWAMLAAQMLPFLKKHAAKIIAGAAGLGLLLLAMLLKLLAKLAAIAAGAATGAVIGFAVGGPVGAVVGGLIGAGAGWIASNWAVPMANFVGSVFSGLGGFASSVGLAVNSLGSAIVSGAGSVLSGTLGALGGFANLTLSLGSISVPAGAVFVPLAIGTGAIGIGGILIGTITATSFFSAGSELPGPISGENEFFKVTKTANQNSFENPKSGSTQDVKFTISLTPKVKLTSIQISDEAKVQPKDNPPFTVEADKTKVDCPQSLDVGSNCTKEIVLTVDSKFNDSILSNTVTVKATPQGQSGKTDSTTAVVTIGNPPAECPRGWPLIGIITQGPEGATSHAKYAYEAIDIGTGVVGTTDVYATVEGVVENVYMARGDPLDRRIVVKTADCQGLITVNFWHLSQTFVQKDEFIKYGQRLGKSGRNGTGPHSHYQFNEFGNRNFKMNTPYIPKAVPRPCDSESQCNTKIDKPL